MGLGYVLKECVLPTWYFVHTFINVSIMLYTLCLWLENILTSLRGLSDLMTERQHRDAQNERY